MRFPCLHCQREYSTRALSLLCRGCGAELQPSIAAEDRRRNGLRYAAAAGDVDVQAELKALEDADATLWNAPPIPNAAMEDPKPKRRRK